MECHRPTTGLCFLFALAILVGASNKLHGHENIPSHVVLESYLGNTTKMLFIEKPWSTKDHIEQSGDISKGCSKLLERFSNATSRYLKCIMCNARPLHYCENCAFEYTEAFNSYVDISKYEENGTSCKDQLERADNVQVVNMVYDFVLEVWDKSDCHNCYNVTTFNGTTTYLPTKETKEMLKKIEDVQTCFHDFSGSDVKNVSVCFLCKRLYSEANEFYHMLDKENKLCSDLEDSMNYTRKMWSKDLNCTVAIHTDLMIYGIAVAIGFVPLLFYLGLYVHGKKQITISRNSRRNSEVCASPTYRFGLLALRLLSIFHAVGYCIASYTSNPVINHYLYCIRVNDDHADQPDQPGASTPGNLDL